MEFISSCATTLLDHSLPAIGRQCGYLWNYDKNLDSLKDQLEKLDDVRKGMTLSVADAKRNVGTIRSRTITWQIEADKISEGAKTFIEECEEVQKRRCMMGLCPNPISRYRFGRRACKKKTDIETVMKEAADQITKVADPAVGLAKKVVLSTEGLFAFESRASIMDDIMKALQDETKNCIGVYGFGGMGKTTLAKQVAARADEGNMFDEVVFAPVTQKVELKQIQEKIASQLDLKLNGFTEAEYAGLIFERLKGKKVLVILDDLWRELDLKEVGVDFGAEHLGCKLLLTSRFQPVLTSMGTRIYFNLGALEEEEAWRLFEEKAGSVLKNSDFHNIGMQVAKRCQGLPVLIVTVAASLSKQQQLSVWNDALNQLKKMNNKKIHDIVNSTIESISYNHLEKTHKQLFLLCGVMGGDASIEEVLQCSWGLNWFDEVSATIHEARNRLHTLILELQEYCLLLDDKGRNSIKMHDVVRDVAISIGRKESNMLSKGEHDPEFKNIWRKDDDLKKCTAMVLRGYPNLPDVPPHLECPLLELFVMSGVSWNSSPSIPETFFEKTVKLQVLGMSRLSFSVLPPSLLFLKNLQTLRVNYCNDLTDISVVGELKKLQILSVAGSEIEELPRGIGQLFELRLLDVRRCHNLKVIPAGLLEGLTRLEELYVSQEFYKWEAEVCVNGSVKTNASLRELKHLHNLCCLEVRAGDDKFLLEDLHFEKLERYEIIVGDFDDLWLDDIEATRKFCVQFSSTSINHLQQGFKRLFERTECLWLREVKGINNIIPALDGDGFSNLKHLRIDNDYEIQYVVNVEDKQRKAVFPCLESLRLDNLVKLQKICNGPLMDESFQNLTSVEVSFCNGLKSLFSFSMATRLSRLLEIEVSYCDALEAIVAEKTKDDGVNINDGVREEIEFSQLIGLTLKGLPKLKNFLFNGEIQNKSHKSLSPEIHTEEEEEEEFKSILPFFAKVSFPKLQELDVSEISDLTTFDIFNFPSKQGDDQFEKVMSKLKSLSIRSTDLKTIRRLYDGHFPPHLFSRLESLSIVGLDVFPSEFLGTIHKQLERFELHDCSFQEIFPYEGEFTNHANDHTLFLPQLTRLFLQKLPELKYICKHDQKKSLTLNILGRLEFIEVEECPLLSNLVQPSTARSLKQLIFLTISGCEKMEKIIGDEDELSREDDNEIIFPELYVLTLEKLPRLTSFCSSPNYTFNFPQLREVDVSECPNMKTFSVGTTTTPMLREVEYEGEERWEGEDLNTTLQKVFAKAEAERLGTSLPSTSSSDHVERNAHVLVKSSEELTEPIPMEVQNPEKEYEVYEDSIETETFKAIVPYTRDKGKGKEPEVSEYVMEHSDPCTRNYTAREQPKSGSVASSSKSSSHSEEFHERLIPPTSSNKQEAEIHGNAAESAKEHQICKHVVDEIYEEDTSTEKATEPIIAPEISEDGAEKSAKLELRELAPLLPSTSLTNHIEAAAQNSAKAQNDATNAEKMADTFEEGEGKEQFKTSIEQTIAGSSEETDPLAEISLSLSTELEAWRSTPMVKSGAANPRKAGETSNHSEMKTPVRASSSAHFIPLLSEFLQIIQNQPLKSMSAEHVQFMENAFRDLSTMNFSIEWFIPYVQKARECLPVLESRREISELESEIAKMEAELVAVKEKKKALEEKYEGVASRIDLDKSLHDC